jgi:hypothetical protein
LGYWSTIGTILWGSVVALGTLYFAGVYGYLGLIGWLGLNLLVGYRFSQARKHSRPDAYDDRLTDERMRTAQEELISDWEKEKEKKT